MNNIIVFSNNKCPKNTKKLSTNIVLMDEKIKDFKNMDQEEFDKGGFYFLKNSGLEPKLMTLCEYNNITNQKTIPKGSYFTVKDKCPNNSELLGQIAIMDWAKSALVVNPQTEAQSDKMLKAINTLTDRNRKTTSYVSTQGNPFLDYNYVLPNLCKAKKDIKIDSNIVLPSSRCQGSVWSDVGTYGLLGSIYDYDFNATNNIKLDITNRILPNQQIILPRMCTGYPNITIAKCIGNTDKRYKNQCDEDMRELCKTIEFGDDNICSCINSKMHTIGNPTYIDSNCVHNGYKTAEMRTGEGVTVSKVDCDDLLRFRENNPNYVIENNEYTNYCKVPLSPGEEPKFKPPIEINYIKYALLIFSLIILSGFFYYKGIPYLKKFTLKTKK
jgi:hypothetical protein